MEPTQSSFTVVILSGPLHCSQYKQYSVPHLGLSEEQLCVALNIPLTLMSLFFSLATGEGSMRRGGFGLLALQSWPPQSHHVAASCLRRKDFIGNQWQIKSVGRQSGLDHSCGANTPSHRLQLQSGHYLIKNKTKYLM